MVEFLLGFIILLTIFYLFIDISFTYVRYHMLVFASQRINRSMAVNLNLSDYSALSTPETLQTQAELEIRNYLSSLGFDGSAVDFAPTGGVTIQCATSTTGPCFLKFSKVRWQSFTGARSLLGAFNITSTTEALIEDPCFQPHLYGPF